MATIADRTVLVPGADLNQESQMLFCLLLMLQSPAPPTATGSELTTVRFRGELLRRDSDGFSPIDAFQLIRFVGSDQTGKGTILVQAGVDRDAWTNSLSTNSAPHIRHVHDGVPYRLELLALKFDRELKEGATWNNGRKAFRVGGITKLADTTCREVFISEGPARNHKVLVDPKTGDVQSLTQRVFMGRGDEFRITVEVDPSSSAKPETDVRFFAELLKVREALNLDSAKPDAALSSGQLKLVASALPALRDAANSRWSKQLLKQMESDTSDQTNRTRKLADLQKTALGKPFPAFSKNALGGKLVDSKQLTGQVVVFHIWSYRDEPLTEPYGQTAYLDFMADKFSGKPVQVLGIYVDSRFQDKTQVAKANRSARKLVEFMNLSYPILPDDGELLKKLGDPRSTGEKLPLWVVVDKAGKIRMWKTGYYNIDSRAGLKELRTLVTKLAE